MSILLAATKLVDSRIALSLEKPLSFDVFKGDTFYVCGRNGSGKTTLLRMIADLEIPQKGDLTKSSSLFFCGHQTGMKASLSVLDNLKFRTAIYKNGSESQIETVLGIFGLEKKKHNPLETLSFGQQRLVSFASAILSPHLLWVLDEPFAHLDEQSEKLFTTVIKNHTKGGGAVLLSTHASIKGETTLFL
jgi:heme exporter protein A